jgi:hypothetical protein
MNVGIKPLNDQLPDNSFRKAILSSANGRYVGIREVAVLSELHLFFFSIISSSKEVLIQYSTEEGEIGISPSSVLYL